MVAKDLAKEIAKEAVLVRVNTIVRRIRQMFHRMVAVPATIRADGKNGGQCQGYTCIAHVS